ncbi:Aldo/keto reductase [Exidia glandulosa HHB12029]|uniref:Aldo/keto reductase n=1 Tax=Exidia glandulosa HHB12029 TaxID=1314781 RepID=A0A165DMN0_EXIGL|nr:Aldo/keto reductase [Exidia glandulosa HHB12029]
MTVPTRTFGKNGPQVSVVGLGLMGMSAYYGPAMPDETAFPLLDKAIELGCTHWDTSNMYGANEDTLNRYFKARPGAREKVFLATKFGVLGWDGKTSGVRGDYDYVIECGNKALERIGTSYIDLFYVKLSGKELEELNKVVRSADVRGDRYSVMADVIRDTVPLQE